MKHFLNVVWCTMLLTVSNFAIAQVVVVPEKAKTHFEANFPDVTDAVWHNNVTNYYASFELNNKALTAHYKLDGTFSHTKEIVPFASLPAEVRESYNKSRIADWEMLESSRIVPAKKPLMFQIGAKKGIAKKWLFFDPTGKEVKSSISL